MRYRKLGRSGLVVSELCLGAMTFGGDGMWTSMGSLKEDDALELVRAAVDSGVNFFDTANVYSNGLSETILGATLRRLGMKRDETIIATKAFGRVQDVLPPNADAAAKAAAERRAKARNLSGLSRKNLLEAVDASLKRLNTDYIDLYQTHGYDPATSLEETMEALNDIVRAGKARYVGFCNLAAWHAAKANGIAAARGFARFESCQMYYSLVGRDIEREIVPMAHQEQMAILPWSPLAGGYLSGKYQRDGKGGPADSRRDKFSFPPVDPDRGDRCVNAMRAIAERRGASVAQIALAWLLKQPAVTSVIIGAKTKAQLDDNLGAVSVELDEADLKALDEASALPEEYPGWMIKMQSTMHGLT